MRSLGFLGGALCALALAGCSLGSRTLASEPPPLAAMDEPPALLTEPADELERASLDPGAFSGVEVTDARASLDALLEAPEGLAVARVVENSPAIQAGIAPGDLLLSVRVLPDGERGPLAWPSQWRDVELRSPPGTELEVELERAGAVQVARLQLVPRWKPAERAGAPRLREDRRAGIVVRAPTEVEARGAGLAPGAGAVVVGLSADSPWLAAGVRFEDLIVSADGESLPAPDVLVERIRAAERGAVLHLELVREGRAMAIDAPLTRRGRELSELSVPLLFSYERSRQESETSALLGLFHLRRTPAAWSLRLFWLLRLSGGDADRLVEVGS